VRWEYCIVYWLIGCGGVGWKTLPVYTWSNNYEQIHRWAPRSKNARQYRSETDV